ncbi:MAG: hypothetical protein EOM53_00445 [Alphaproteobacteria bacterium]|nr:hypothetical protein [Alphaproteobacteria bacterium]
MFFIKQQVRKYGHIISLGYNCEISFQFFLKYHFVESSLFAWVNCLNVDNLIYALSHLDKVCSGEIKNIKPMWKCENTGICFHGKTSMKIMINNLSAQILKEDKEELLSRVSYLKNKFIQTSSDGKKNLYIFKYPSKEESDITEKINLLYEKLDNLVENEFDLLIILENDFCSKIQENVFNPHIFIRRVDFFTKEEDVTSKENDFKHYKKIFKEFRPDFKQKKKKKFKFEEI